MRVKRFDTQKALELIAYLANRLPEPSAHSVSKLLYFADKEHLSRYGRLILGDDYVAMQHGPVPSDAYDIIKVAAGRIVLQKISRSTVEEVFVVRGNMRIEARRDGNTDLFSESELECIGIALAEHGQKNFAQLTRDSHDAAWKSADENDFMSLQDIVGTLPNAEEVREHLSA